MLEAEPLIIARLTTQLGSLATPPALVCSVGAVVGSLDMTGKYPLVVVEPGTGTEKSDTGRGRGVEESQLWHVTTTIKLVPDQKSFATTLQDFTPLLEAIVNALSGWQCSAQNITHFHYAGREDPQFEPGAASITLNFTADWLGTGTG